MNTYTKYHEDEEVLVDDLNLDYGDPSALIVYNDDVNTFDWVIECLMDICGHSFEQSEQLSLIIHFKGKATVKTAPLDSLKPLKDALVDRGLSAVIEGVKQTN
ncbi:MAG: ATP-dependent Clp protease adaptor ClpS [Saprospiraceae bacterium]|jgi:ATP-dependent Clp protease adaptor protein ClpS|nr:ATP-dependent Clp protease adaptor ClpS [Saprospiraceae bacterium]MBK6480648.1 ATP-dependent Clp protease adaptor ClpS [Saprospiraceae bacterium]MBK6816992.1 ATP-dependent Clp protease adaptor ClpS [Saprospiraceae bacterium]MBK7371521.1 ATP-dependent Clp protease adaptor ClpS [Saprospiraceae bacterium]MBK7435982.1 ATP-dependent Clp protease adaptor ClpS [Saprospiraceae bacterium]